MVLPIAVMERTNPEKFVVNTKSSIKKVKKKNNNLNLITRIFPRRIAM
jgi:hypothetical protein